VRTTIVNTTVIVGDGKTVLTEASLRLENEIVKEVIPLKYLTYESADYVLDAGGGYVFPGIINHHAHGVTMGPLFPYCSFELSWQRVKANLDTHLSQGTTTVLNLDGMSTPWEVEIANKHHPVRIKTATLHTPLNKECAVLSDGRAFKDKHRALNAEEMVRLGALAIGEIGSPGTTNATTAMAIRLGKPISTPQAGAIVKLFRRNPKPTLKRVEETLSQWDLMGMVKADEAEALYMECFKKPVGKCNDAIIEGIDYSKRLNVPIVVHNSPDTQESVLEAAKALGPMLVAGHSNFMFTPDEAVSQAKRIKADGGLVDILTGDSLGAKQLLQTPEVGLALLRAGVVDLISTDFCGGFHDPILQFLEFAIEEGAIGLAQGVAKCTHNVAAAIPGLAHNRGLITEGSIADLCITEKDRLSRVKHIFIGGYPVWPPEASQSRALTLERAV